MRYLILFLILTSFVSGPAPALAAKDQDKIDHREVTDKSLPKEAKEAEKYLKQIEDAIEDMEKELKEMKKNVQESVKGVKLVAKLAGKKRINLKKINNEWDDVVDGQKDLEKALKEIEGIHRDMEKAFKAYDKAFMKIAK